MKKQPIHFFFMLFFVPTIIWSQWSHDPAADARVLLGSFFHNVISDGYGGAIIIGRKDCQFSAQRVDQNGYVLWDLALQGLPVVTLDSINDVTIGRETYLWPDGKGGIFIAYDYFDFIQVITDPEYVIIYDIDTYIQHLDDKGQRTRGNKGVPLSISKGTNPDYYYISSSRIQALGGDGQGGIVAVWDCLDHDMNGNEIVGTYIQRVDSLGNPLWEKDGRKIIDAYTIKAIVDGECSSFALIYWRNGAAITKYLIKVNFDGQLLWQKQLPINFIESDIISDGLGGAFVLSYYYYDQNKPETKSLLAQRFDKDGNELWREGGIVICDSIGDQGFIESAIKFKESDLIVSWSEFKEGRHVYLQKIDNNGTLLWNEQGLTVSSVNSSKAYCHLLQSSENEIIAAFHDNRDTVGITYAQKFNENGEAQWGSSDVLVSTRVYPGSIISDGRGGAIICSGQFSPRGVCIYRIDKNGKLGGVVSVKEPKEIDLPKEFDLYQNHPNPFMNETIIGYFLPQGSFPIQVKVYDINGKEVVTLVNESKTAGSHMVKWSGLNNDRMPVSSGIYFYQLQIGSYHLVKKLLFFR